MTDIDPKTEAKADKARAKAQRPWYKKKRWLGLLVLAAVILIAVVSGGGDGEQASNTGDEDGDESSDATDRVSVGEPASDGQFAFTVTEPLDCGQKTIGEEPMAEEAQGQWCILTATVENTGDEARGLSASAQLLYDTQDREFEASMPMAVVGDSPIYEQINPGNQVEGRFFFDVPQDFTPSHVELHDSPMSGGVQVDLS